MSCDCLDFSGSPPKLQKSIKMIYMEWHRCHRHNDKPTRATIAFHCIASDDNKDNDVYDYDNDNDNEDENDDYHNRNKHNIYNNILGQFVNFCIYIYIYMLYMWKILRSYLVIPGNILCLRFFWFLILEEEVIKIVCKSHITCDSSCPTPNTEPKCYVPKLTSIW